MVGPRVPHPVRAPVVLVGLGLLLLQVTWLGALPPFRGMDEADHVYRAAGVAAGQWRLREPSPVAQGQLVVVPEALARAAAAQCASVVSKSWAECRGTAAGPGRAAVTTRAGTYDPAFYWVVGRAGALAHGVGSLDAMRICATLLCWLLLVSGLGCLASVRAGPAAWLGALAGITPTFVYSSVVVAPNGIEMAAGFTFWCALVCLLRAGDVSWRRRETGLLLLATLAAVVLVTPRALGPLWCLMTAVTVAVFAGLPALVARVRQRPAWFVLAGTTVAAATAASLGWSVESGLAGDVRRVPTAATTAATTAGPHGVLDVVPVHVWFVQSVAAFPYRDQPASPAIQVSVGLVLLALVWTALRRGRAAARRGVALAVVLGLGVPVLLVLTTRGTEAAQWQGRYALPFLVGVPLLAGLVVQDAPWRSRFDPGPMAVLALALLGLAQVWSVVWVLRSELARPVSVRDPGWHQPPVALTALAAAAAWALVVAGVRLTARGGAPRPPSRGPAVHRDLTASGAPR